MYRHISTSLQKTLDEIRARRASKHTSLSTGYKSLDRVIGGIEPSRIYTIAGLSGSGKSAMIEQIKRNLVDYNPDVKIRILSLDFEMTAEDQLIRATSSKVDKTYSEILSFSSPLDDLEYKRIEEQLIKCANYPIYIVDTPLDPDGIYHVIKDFVSSDEEDSFNIVTIDNLSFIDGSVDDKKAIDQVMKNLVKIKKQVSQLGKKLSIFVVSQLNRNIEDRDRVVNQALQYPTKKDIYATSAVYFSSDVVIITHKPSIIPGMGEYYGPPKKQYSSGLPVYCPSDPTKAMIYWHIIKQRFGSLGILMMVDNLKWGRIDPFVN